MLPRLKLGLVGAGPVSLKYHVPAIRAVPEVLAAVVADVDRARARKVAEICPFLQATDKFEDLCGQVDVAIVALPNALHQPVACRLLESGIHVLVEKPMARNVAECRQMLAAAERGGAIVVVAHNRRFRPNVLAARKLLSQGFIGPVTRIRAEEGSVSDWPRSKAYFDPVQAGGGALLDVGIHTIDLIRYLVGEFTELKYKGNQTANSVESEAELEFELQCGARGTLLSSRDRNLRNEMVLEGPEGSLALGLWGQEMTLCHPRGKAFRSFPAIPLAPLHRAMDATFVEQLFQFVKAIRDGGPPAVDGCEGLRAVAVAEWAYRGANPLAGHKSELVAADH